MLSLSQFLGSNLAPMSFVSMAVIVIVSVTIINELVNLGCTIEAIVVVIVGVNVSSDCAQVVLVRLEVRRRAGEPGMEPVQVESSDHHNEGCYHQHDDQFDELFGIHWYDLSSLSLLSCWGSSSQSASAEKRVRQGLLVCSVRNF